MEEICTECHFDESATPPREVPAALASLKIKISDSIRSIPGDELRRRPAPTVWSPVEYLGHLRESMAFIAGSSNVPCPKTIRTFRRWTPTNLSRRPNTSTPIPTNCSHNSTDGFAASAKR